MAALTAQQVQELVHRITGFAQMKQQVHAQQTTAQNDVAVLSQQSRNRVHRKVVRGHVME